MLERHRKRLNEVQKYYAENPHCMDGTCPFVREAVETAETCLTETACGECKRFAEFNQLIDGLPTEEI